MPIVASPNEIPAYPAPVGGRLSDAMLADFEAAGVLILRDFVSIDACNDLRNRAAELVDGFDPAAGRSVFSTTDQEQLDILGTLGGPLVRDRLWFFAALGRWTQSYAGVNLFGEDINWHEYRDNRMLKLTLQASPANKIVGEYIDGPTTIESIGADSTDTTTSAFAHEEEGGGL